MLPRLLAAPPKYYEHVNESKLRAGHSPKKAGFLVAACPAAEESTVQTPALR